MAATRRRSKVEWSRPSGAANSMWAAVAKKSDPIAVPNVNSSGMSEALARLSSQAKPVAAISMPTRFSGSRDQANSPAPTKPQPTTSPSTASTPRMGRKSLVRISARSISPSATAAPARPHRARRSEVRGAPPGPRPRAPTSG